MIQVPKSVTDDILADLQGYKPGIDLGMPCPSCGKRPLPLRMLSHLFAAGVPAIRCSHCHTDMPLATDIQDTPSFFSTGALDTLRDPDGGELSASAWLDIGSLVGMPEEGKESILEDLACADMYPRIPLAEGFYDGTARERRFGKVFLPFREHFHTLCNLKALEIIVETKDALPKDEVELCFRRAFPGMLIAVYSMMSEAGRQWVTTTLVPKWDAIVLSVAYTCRALARADQLLATLVPNQLTRQQMVEASRSADIHLVHLQILLTECLAEFFFARFFVLRQAQQQTSFKGGYEASRLMEQIDLPLKSMASGSHFLDYCISLDPNEHPRLFNATVVWTTYRHTGSSSGVKIDENNVRVAPIGKDLSRCFIATAACGSPHAADVMVLQQFRDDLLLSNVVGRAFTRMYERLSPPLANRIESSRVLKMIARRLVVRPTALLARVCLRSSVSSETNMH